MARKINNEVKAADDTVKGNIVTITSNLKDGEKMTVNVAFPDGSEDAARMLAARYVLQRLKADAKAKGATLGGVYDVTATDYAADRKRGRSVDTGKLAEKLKALDAETRAALLAELAETA